MRRLPPLVTLFLFVPFVLIQSDARGAARGPGVSEAMEVAEGFRIDKVAGGALTRHPMMATFDDRGRLYVAESSGLNLSAAELSERLPNQIRRLEDTNGDGVFDKATVFADKLTFPQGAAWLDGSLYVASPPSMWRFQDTDDDGVADVREELATGFNYTGNAASVHGPFVHPDGRLYWCHGRKGHEVYQKGGDLVSKNVGARVWTSKPDGSDIQILAGGGMDNPTELTFTSTGDVLGTVPLFYGRPRGDVLVHWVHGGAYPRYDIPDALVGLKSTGPLLGPVLNLGHVAPSGLTRYRDGGLGVGFQDDVFLVEFNTRRLLRIEMRGEGATFGGTPAVFASSDDPDVHFTDVLQDADGSLLLIDTGGWFRQGCPTSRIAKPDVHGAIYRITRLGASPVKDARGLKLKWEGVDTKTLTGRLDDARFAVRDRALANLGKRGDESVEILREAMRSGPVRTRSNALWALTRIGSTKAQAAARAALGDADAGVRQVACHSAFTTQDKEAVGKLISLIESDPVAATRRVAAQALGRLGDAGAVKAILDTLCRPENAGDRFLEHALIYALIELEAPVETAEGLRRDHPGAIKAAVLALDQMDSASFKPEWALGLMRHNDSDLAEAALEIVGRHGEWSLPVSAELLEILEQRTWGNREEALIDALLPGSLGNVAVARSIGEVMGDNNRLLAQRVRLLRVLAERGGPPARAWVEPIGAALASQDTRLVSEAVAAAGALQTETFDAALQRVAEDPNRPGVVRIAAMRALGAGGKLSDGAFGLLIGMFEGEASLADRLEAARLLSGSKLNGRQLRAAIDALRHCGSLEVKVLSQTVTQSDDVVVGMAAVEALEDSPGLYGLGADDYLRLFRRYPLAVNDAAEPTFRRLMRRSYEKANRISEMETATLGGDAKRGAALYASGAGACKVCHQVNGLGGEVGPNLSNVGAIRSRRDLLEAIAYPSDSFARDYETYLVTMDDGSSRLGTLSRETSEAIYLMDASGEEAFLPREQIVSRTPSSLSLMPLGLDQSLGSQGLADLVAYLISLK